MTDFKIDTAVGGTWDMVVADGEFATVDGRDEIAQRVAIACKTHLGEWIFNTDLGLPWREEILVKNPDIPRITDRFRALIIGVEGVTKILSLSIAFDPATRAMNMTGEILTDDGAVPIAAAL